MPDQPPLRRPWDRTIADCMWLARFVDKARRHLDGTLDEDFAPFFGHRLATDGTFLAWFELELATLLDVVRTHESDTSVDDWFRRQSGVTLERIQSWNRLAPRLGRAGEPMERAFSFARRKYYGDADAPSEVNSVFTGIAWDEGCLDEAPATDE